MEVVILSVLDLDLNAVWIDYMSSLAKDRPAAITGGHSNQDPPYRQKPTRYILHFFANHSWSLLLCSPVIRREHYGMTNQGRDYMKTRNSEVVILKLV